MFTVIVLSDEPLVQSGLKALLSQDSEFEVARVCSTPAEVIHAAAALQPDIILCAARPDTDLAIPDLRMASPRSAIVVLGREITPEFARDAMDLGVRGFVNSTEGPEVVRECLRSAARGELWMERSLSMALLDARPINLSKRQSQLVNLLAHGLKNKEIAATLGISESTVKAYLTGLFEKVGAKDRFELALFGLKNMKTVSDDLRNHDWRKSMPMRSFVRRKTDKQPAA
jgi:DNA-binding NarL/FixJ family response regulator